MRRFPWPLVFVVFIAVPVQAQRGNSTQAGPTTPGFGSSSGARGFGGSGTAAQKPEQQMDERTARYVDRFIAQYDRNKNGRLEASEWEGARWGSDPKESDLNKDGVLTKEELASRMANRWGNRSSGSDRGARPQSDTGRTGRSFGSRPDSGRSGGEQRSTASSSSSGSGDAGDRIRRYAEGLLKRYDRSGNGVLEKDEWSQMRERYASADANKDSVITLNELAALLSNDSRASGNSRGTPTSTVGRFAGRSPRGAAESDDKKSYRFLTPAERLQNLLLGRDRDWFLEKDQNGDGQIAMSEFSDAWSQEKVDEFQALDANTDGVVTPKEYLQSKSK